MSDEKIVRICWNTNLWRFPSGPQGKSKNKESYEEIVGYGHEEWLFDLDKVIDDYHYSFLQAANTGGRKVNEESHLKVCLYSIDDETKTRWWIGLIDDLQIVSEPESEKVYQLYREYGWFDEMLFQVDSVGGLSNDLRQTDPKIFFTVKFKPSNLVIEEPPKKFASDDPAVASARYNFQPFITLPEFVSYEFNFVPGYDPVEHIGWRTYQEKKIKTNNLHDQIQKSVYLQLTKIFGNHNVGREHPTPNGTRIDLVARDDKGSFIFYEIKTSPTILCCIREALSQLLEYAYYPNNDFASKLVIISPNKITDEASIYIRGLRKKFKIPIYYQAFDMDKMKLLEDCH